MSDHLIAVHKLRAEASALGYGATKIALLEEAVGLADVHGDIELAFDLRLDLMTAAEFGGRGDMLLVAFSWCLAHHDRDPQLYPPDDLFWRYKWVVSTLPGFPHVSRQQIEALFADMSKRFAAAGSTLHAVHGTRAKMLDDMGDLQGAGEAYAQMSRTQRDWLSDCLACVPDCEVGYLATTGADEAAVSTAESIFSRNLRCAEVPHRTYGKVLLPLVRLGRPGEAMKYHQKGYRLVAANPAFLAPVSMHLVFLVLTDNLAKATKLLEKHLPTALEAPGLLSQLEFLFACRLLLERLAETDKKTIKLRLPSTFAMHERDGSYQVDDLMHWFAEQASDLARRFDARNGNNFYSQRNTNLAELKKIISPCPLSARE